MLIDFDESIHMNEVSLYVNQTKKGFSDHDSLSNIIITIITFESVNF